MNVYYNENNPFSARWLTNLATAGLVSAGRIDARSIAEVTPADLASVTRAHFFAGIGGWDYALQLAGWPTDLPIWTGSCPCQPFSRAGKRLGTSDPRHLWPVWFELLRQCRPSIVVGEQVASIDAIGWLNAVFDDLEGQGYACAAADLCAAGVGAPHIRQRLYWVALAPGQRRGSGGSGIQSGGPLAPIRDPWGLRGDSRVADTDSDGRAQGPGSWVPDYQYHAEPRSSVEWLMGRDGKARPIESGLVPLAHGVPGRVGKLRAYGNAIVPQVAARFLRAFL